MPVHRLTLSLILGTALFLAVLLVLSTVPPVGRAATINNINTFSDGINPGDGVCTLREAISNTNAHGDVSSGDCVAADGNDSIQLITGTYVLTVTGAGEDSNASDDLDLTGGGILTISGKGAALTSIDAAGIDRVLHILSGTVVISGLTVTGGSTSDDYGGGIRNDGAVVSLINVVVRDNVGYRGGGVYVGGDGQLTIVGGEIYNNTASDDGGGLNVHDINGNAFLSDTDLISNSSGCYGGGMYVFEGAATLSDVAILSNTAIENGGGASVGTNGGALTLTNHSLVAYNQVTGTSSSNGGGGLAVDASGAHLTVLDSQVFSNAAGAGGGVFISQSGGSVWLERTAIVSNSAKTGAGVRNDGDIKGALTLINCTVSGNRAVSGGLGGGIYVNDNATTIITYTTIASNTATGDGGLHASEGTTVTVHNTILAHNNPRNCSPGVTSNGFNLDSDTTCNFSASGDITGTTPLLDRLTSEEGTLVHPLLKGSPAVDAGLCVVGIDSDQRGEARPDDGCDMGAYESSGWQVYLPLLLRDY